MRKCGCHSHNGFQLEIEDQLDLELAQRVSLEGLTPMSDCVSVDRLGSVSASEHLESHWDDDVIEEQYRRFHNGS